MRIRLRRSKMRIKDVKIRLHRHCYRRSLYIWELLIKQQLARMSKINSNVIHTFRAIKKERALIQKGISLSDILKLGK